MACFASSSKTQKPLLPLLVLNQINFEQQLFLKPIEMGGAKSLVNMYTYKEYLYWYIEKGDISKIEQVLGKKPQLIDATLTASSKTTALYRASFNGNFEIVKLLVEKYHANVNHPTQIGESPIIGAVKRNKLKITKYLLDKGADAGFLAKTGLTVLEYAILPGNYEIALTLFERTKADQLRSAGEYAALAKQYDYRYVNYQMILIELRDKVPPENVRDFLTREKKILNDPVIDPRQTWKQWLWRNAEFKDPPLVERSDLPPELHPQNRKLGKVRHFFTKMTISRLSQRPNFNPNKEVQSQEMNEGSKNSISKEAKNYQTNTVS